jgi:C4-dicarboxylate-specific signal transduction histidine kinase
MIDSFKNAKIHRILDDILWRIDGTSFPISYLSAPIFSEGICIGSVVCFEDLTEQRRLQKELEFEQVKSLQNSKMAALGEISAGIAHEINNPLGVLSLTLQLLESSAAKPELFSAKILNMQRSVDRISKIVTGLKKFSRSSQDQPHQPVRLASIITEALNLTEIKANKTSTPLTLEAQSEAFILCEEVEIEQVLINLINNAIDAVQKLPEKWVKLKIFEQDSNAVIQVIDSGSGISKELEQKIFQPFFTTKPVGEGTGLGLSITIGILKKHNATIQIKTLDQHTCFELNFPMISKS